MTLEERLRHVEQADLRLVPKVALDQHSLVGRAVASFAKIGDQPPMAVLSGTVVAAGLVRRDQRLARSGLRMLAAHSMSTMVKLLVKDLVDRTRPRALGKKPYRAGPGDSKDSEMRSFPSGHSAGAAAVAGGLAPDFPLAAVPAALGATAIAAAQPASRNHFVSDAVAGVAIGIAVSLLARLLVPPFDEIEQPAPA
jgi:undecaprenyl-diphosphatase